MKLRTENVQKLVRTCIKVVKKDHMDQRVQNLHLAHTDGKLFITGSNNAVQVTGFMETGYEDEFEVLVPGHPFSNAVQLFTKEEMDLRVNKNSITVSGDGNSNMQVSRDDFPFIQGDSQEEITAPGSDLAECISFSSAIIDPNAMVDHIKGVCVKSEEDTLVVFGMDNGGVVQRATGTVRSGSMDRLIIPQSALGLVQSIAKDNFEATIKAGNGIEVRSGNYAVRSLGVRGKYPNTESFFPPEIEDESEVSTVELLNLAKKARAHETPAVILEFDEEKLNVSTVQDNVTFDGDMEYKGGEPKRFALNVHNLIKVLDKVRSDTVILNTSQESQKVEIRGEHCTVMSKFIL